MPDEEMAKLYVTQQLALNIAARAALRAIRDSLPGPLRRLFS